MSRQSILRIGVLLALAGGLIYAIFLSGIDPSSISVDAVRTYLQDFGFWAPLIVLAAYSARPLIPILPPLPVAMAVGALYGTLAGTVIIAIGSTLAGLLAFSLARFVGQDFVNRKQGEGKISRIKQRIESGGWATVMVARFLNVPWDVVSYASGLSRIRLRDFFLGTAIAAVPLSFVAVFFGSALSSIRSMSDLLSPAPLAAFGVFVAGIVIPILVKRRLGDAY